MAQQMAFALEYCKFLKRSYKIIWNDFSRERNSFEPSSFQFNTYRNDKPDPDQLIVPKSYHSDAGSGG